uniref:Cystatin domain-containing protein n=1 Tax=Noccaea caerulescens TaxID=107243 RepID=A0A1J3CFM3_NOCCA
MGEFEGWQRWLEPAFLLWEPGDRHYERHSYTTRTEKDEPLYTPEEELANMENEVNNSDGFDINFKLYRCIFNYHLANLNSHDFVDKPDTLRDSLERLSQHSLDDYNKRNETKFEFVKVEKANFHVAAGIMFLITFDVKDPYDGIIKPFQARVRHLKNTFTEYIFCRPKPNHEVEYFGTVKEDVDEFAEKLRLE